MAGVQSTGHLLQFGVNGAVHFKAGSSEYVAFPGVQNEDVPLNNDDQHFLTVLPTDPELPWTKSALIERLRQIEVRDDASHPDFRRFLLFWAVRVGHVEISEELIDFLQQHGINYAVIDKRNVHCEPFHNSNDPASAPTTAGSYLWIRGRLAPIYRLYEDCQNAFIQALQPHEGDAPYRQFRVAGEGPETLSVPVPTRQSQISSKGVWSDLTGVRVVVKDIFEICGLIVSANSRAFLRLASPSKTTAPAIQRLIDKGVVIVGKTKLSSMISREEPSECVDFASPFNPRGDGQQSPAGSSSGSAAAIAAYDWLDYAIGSDSTGSTRRPAGANGCFAIRLSIEALPSIGMMPCFRMFDALSVFARSIRGMADFVQSWTEPEDCTTMRPPTSIIVPTDYFPVSNEEQQQMLNAFIDDLGACFNVNIRKVLLRQLWEENRPEEACGRGLREFLKNVGRNSFIYEFYHSTDHFREQYQRIFNESPQVNRVVRARWATGEKITPEEHEDAVRRLGVYKAWLLEHVLLGTNPVMILPLGQAEENYRDEPAHESPVSQDAWDQLWLSPVLRAPEVTVPVGQIRYTSRMTNHEEMLPVVVSILGMPGTDVSLLRMVEKALQDCERPLSVAAGRQMFDDWEIVERP